MRYSVGLPVDHVQYPDEFVTGDAVAEMAAAVEAAGLDAVYVTDHPAPDDRWLEGGGHHAQDPLVALAFAAAATSRINLHTHVFVAAYRNPFLAAKGAATLQAMSGGRLILGVAAGYLKPEFAALGVSFDDRNDLLDETIALMRRAWTEYGVAVEGDGYTARGVTQLPRPASIPMTWASSSLMPDSAGMAGSTSFGRLVSSKRARRIPEPSAALAEAHFGTDGSCRDPRSGPRRRLSAGQAELLRPTWCVIARQTVTPALAAKKLGCAMRTIERILRDGAPSRRVAGGIFQPPRREARPASPARVSAARCLRRELPADLSVRVLRRVHVHVRAAGRDSLERGRRERRGAVHA